MKLRNCGIRRRFRANRRRVEVYPGYCSDKHPATWREGERGELESWRELEPHQREVIKARLERVRSTEKGLESVSSLLSSSEVELHH